MQVIATKVQTAVYFKVVLRKSQMIRDEILKEQVRLLSTKNRENRELLNSQAKLVDVDTLGDVFYNIFIISAWSFKKITKNVKKYYGSTSQWLVFVYEDKIRKKVKQGLLRKLLNTFFVSISFDKEKEEKHRFNNSKEEDIKELLVWVNSNFDKNRIYFSKYFKKEWEEFTPLERKYLDVYVIVTFVQIRLDSVFRLDLKNNYIYQEV